MRLYHFTSTRHLPLILHAGTLAVTDSMLHPNLQISRTMTPGLWLLDTPTLEGHTHGLAVPGWRVDKTEIRFTLDVPDGWVRPWVNWARAQGIEHRWLQKVINDGGGSEAADHWWIAFRTITADRWVAVDNMHTGQPVELVAARS